MMQNVGGIRGVKPNWKTRNMIEKSDMPNYLARPKRQMVKNYFISYWLRKVSKYFETQDHRWRDRYNFHKIYSCLFLFMNSWNNIITVKKGSQKRVELWI